MRFRVLKCDLHVSPYDLHVLNDLQFVEFLLLVVLQKQVESKEFDGIQRFEFNADAVVPNGKRWGRHTLDQQAT